MQVIHTIFTQPKILPRLEYCGHSFGKSLRQPRRGGEVYCCVSIFSDSLALGEHCPAGVDQDAFLQLAQFGNGYILGDCITL